MKKDDTIKEQHKIIITVDGGLIQDIENIPPGIQVEIHDFDTEGADDSEITMINNDEAVTSIWTSKETKGCE